MSCNKEFKIIIRYDEKEDVYINCCGYYLIIEKNKIDEYKVVENAKKLATFMCKIKNSILITLALSNNYNILFRYWISFYCAYLEHSRISSEDNIYSLRFCIADDVIVDKDDQAVSLAKIIYDFDDILHKQNNEVNPSNFEFYVRNMLEKYNIAYRLDSFICDASSKFSCIYAVGKSGQHLPRLLRVDIFEKNGGMPDKICLIGKGITYDTGGYNLKPWKYMLGMHTDKAGALFALFTGILSRLFYNLGSTVIMVVAENKVNSSAMCAGDVYYNYAGMPVKIEHTDAEGRVVLSDAISYACQNTKFANMFTFATLTGAASYILGPDTGIFMSDSKIVSDNMMKISKLWSERLWSLPFSDWQRKFITFEHNKVTGVRNSCDGSSADTILAGTFLHYFFKAKYASFTHLDLAPLFEKPLLESHSSAYLLPMMANIIDSLFL